MRYIRTDDTGSDNIIEIKGAMIVYFNLSKSKEGFDMTLYYKNWDSITTKIDVDYKTNTVTKSVKRRMGAWRVINLGSIS